MADYKTLVNDVLSELNEVQITTVGSNKGIQEFVEKAVLKAVRDINNKGKEWPYLISQQSQAITPGIQLYNLPSTYRSIDWESFIIRPEELLTNTDFASNITNWTDKSTGAGSSAHTTTGNGRARLAGGVGGIGAIEQSVSTINTIVYRIIFRNFTNQVKLRIGTTSGGTEILTDTTFTITNTGEGTFHKQDFTATTGGTFIRFQNDADNNADLDLASCFEIINAKELEYIDFDEWRRLYKADETNLDPTLYAIPKRVFRTQKDQFGVSTIPDRTYTVDFDAWVDPTEMSADTDTPSIPAEWHDVIRERTLFYAYRHRNHPEEMFTARDNAKDGIKSMRVKLVGHPHSMKDLRR